MRSRLVDLPARLIHETELAWKLDMGGDRPVWIAKSAAAFDGETLTCEERLAIEKGLV